MTQAANRLGDLVSGLLDKGYEQAAGATLHAVGASVTSGIVAQRLAELDAEAARLAANGQRLQPDNPVLRALLADLEPVLGQNGVRIDAGAAQTQQAGVTAAGHITRGLAFPGIRDAQLAGIGVQWNTPDPEAVNALVGYVNTPGWAAEIGAYPGRVLQAVQHQAIRGMVEGWGASRTAREIRKIAEGMTVAQANNLMRTTQLQSFRDASAIHSAANADILTGQIRIAALDDRTCLACIALHGTRLAVGERVEDHHQGRCMAIQEVRGRPRSVTTGEQWFAGLPEERQQAIAGNAAFEALASGKATLRDFVQPYQDKTFGRMLREASVKELVGNA